MKPQDILCRIWDEENQKMIHGGFQLWFDSHGEMKDVPGTNYPLIEIMFYTGLIDKNGKKSFHKDIIKRYDEFYVLEWHSNFASWYLQTKGGSWHGLSRSDFALTCEITGHIFQKNKNVI